MAPITSAAAQELLQGFMESGKGRAPGVATAADDCDAPGVFFVASEDIASDLLDAGELKTPGELFDGNGRSWGAPRQNSMGAGNVGWETLTDRSMTAESALLAR